MRCIRPNLFAANIKNPCQVESAIHNLPQQLRQTNQALLEILDLCAGGNLYLELIRGELNVLLNTHNRERELNPFEWALDHHFGWILAGAEISVIAID